MTPRAGVSRVVGCCSFSWQPVRPLPPGCWTAASWAHPVVDRSVVACGKTGLRVGSHERQTGVPRRTCRVKPFSELESRTMSPLPTRKHDHSAPPPEWFSASNALSSDPPATAHPTPTALVRTNIRVREHACRVHLYGKGISREIRGKKMGSPDGYVGATFWDAGRVWLAPVSCIPP